MDDTWTLTAEDRLEIILRCCAPQRGRHRIRMHAEAFGERFRGFLMRIPLAPLARYLERAVNHQPLPREDRKRFEKMLATVLHRPPVKRWNGGHMIDGR